MGSERIVSEYAEKIRSIAAPRKMGQLERQEVLDERDGTRAGEHVIHWDGRQDAIVEPKPIDVTPDLPAPGEE